MRITRIEIFGFKSFVDRFVLNFDSNMIGIVGPNGCGKSNIVDALRWVLGETHAKQLRGNVFDDLIFNGSESRRPLGMAEVSVTIRPDQGWSPATVSVNDFKADEFEGLVAKLDTALEEENSITPENDANESAGNLNGSSNDSVGDEQVLESHTQGDDNIIPESLLAIPGLFKASEIQLTRRLYRSGESEYFINKSPCRLRDLTEFYRLIGLGARGLSIVQQGQIGQIVSKKPIERRELLEEAAGISGFRSKMEAASRKLVKAQDNLARLEDIILEVSKQVKILRRQAKRASERKSLKDELHRLEREMYIAKTSQIVIEKTEDQTNFDKCSKELTEARENLEVFESEQESQRARLAQLDIELRELRNERDILARSIAEEKEHENQVRVVKEKLDGKLRVNSSSIEQLHNREARITEELKGKIVRIEELTIAAEELSRTVSTREAEVEEFCRSLNDSPEFNNLAEEKRTTQSNLDELEIQLSGAKELRQEISKLERELEISRKESLRANTKVNQLIAEEKTLTLHLESLKQETKAAFDDNVKGSLLAEVLDVPEEFSRAVTAVLGERSQYLICSNIEETLDKIDPDKQQSGRVGLLRHHQRSSHNIPAESFENISAEPLLDKIKVQAEHEATALCLLSNVFLVGNRSDALKLVSAALENSNQKADLIAVTRDGEVATPWGFYFGTEPASLFALRNRLARVADKVEEAQKETGSLELNSEGILEKLKAKRSEQFELEKIREKVLAVQQVLRTLNDRERRLNSEQLGREREARQGLGKLQAEAARISEALVFEKRAKETGEKELEQIAVKKAKLSEEKANLEAEMSEIAQRIRAEFETPDSANRLKIDELVKSQELLNLKLGEQEKDRDLISLELSEVSRKYATLRHDIERLQDQEVKVRVKIERAELELGMLTEELNSRLGEGEDVPNDIEIKDFLEIYQDDLVSFTRDIQERVYKLRRRLEREGDVDPESIELCSQEEKRLDDMEIQRDDLCSACEILEKTIKQLREVSQKRFLATFVDVKAKFESLVPRLFGGGAGQLTLVNGEDPLNSGVDLSVRPPGKRLRSLELLSGGEKALAATAVIVAMFLHRPSPICVLDEVDAPLDDSNLERFLALISEISEKTQFLIITHNKQSMAAVNRLVGITMQEKGVSKALEVDFAKVNEALELEAVNA